MKVKKTLQNSFAHVFSDSGNICFIFLISLVVALMTCLLPSIFAGTLPTVATVESRLAAEIDRMIDAGHLAPGVCYMEQHYGPGDAKRNGFELDDYWHNPGELIYTLAIAIPYLPDDLKPQAKNYLESEFSRFPPHTYVHMGPEGALREIAPRPPEYASNWAQFYYQRTKSATVAVNWGTGSPVLPWSFPPFNIYACWKYAEVFPEQAPAILEELRSKVVELPALGEYGRMHPHILNAYIAGYYGYLNLQSLAGEARSADVEEWLDAALQERVLSLDLDPKTLPGAEAGGFIWLVPELGDYLYKNARSRVEEFINYQDWAAPYWHIARAEEITRVDTERNYWEGYRSHIYETASQFQARAQILKWPRAKLERHIDARSVYRGDLTYMQNLVAALQAGADVSPARNLQIATDP
jgi:hypothetical protein